MTTLIATPPPAAGGFTRRGACPALSAPMSTGDGLLVRLNPADGGITPATLAGLCEAAQIHGNGTIEVTARGSVQIRGLTKKSAPEFACTIDRLGISVRTGVPVQTGVLAGLDPTELYDSTALCERIRTAIRDAGLDERLGPKVSVVVDGGGRTALGEVEADIRLTALGRDEWLVAIAGNARTARLLGLARTSRRAVDACLVILSRLAERGENTRARDLRDTISVNDFNTLEVFTESGPAKFVHISLPGLMKLSDTRYATVIGLPFGHSNADRLMKLAGAAEALGATEIRPAPQRSLVVLCGEASQAVALRIVGEALGFVVSETDPRQAISACSGAPECASGHIPARRMAAEIADDHKGLFDGSVHLHISGCAKGCAHPAQSDLAIVGAADRIGLVVSGTARDEPLAFAGKGDVRRGFAKLAGTVAAARRDTETTAQTIERIGPSALSEAFGQGRT